VCLPVQPCACQPFAFDKQPDGPAKTREVRLCTVWRAEARDPQSQPAGGQGSVTYTAATENAATPDTGQVPSEFTQRVLREASRRRFTHAERPVVIGDGVPWIWKIARELFPHAIQIVDKFHVKGRLSQPAKLLCAEPGQARLRARRRHEELDSGRFTDLLRLRPSTRRSQRRDPQMLPVPAPQPGTDALPAVRGGRALHRFGRRRGRLQRRGRNPAPKRSGMRWTLRGANAVIALRCCQLGGTFQDFRERRSERRAASLPHS